MSGARRVQGAFLCGGGQGFGGGIVWGGAQRAVCRPESPLSTQLLFRCGFRPAAGHLILMEICHDKTRRWPCARQMEKWQSWSEEGGTFMVLRKPDLQYWCLVLSAGASAVLCLCLTVSE